MQNLLPNVPLFYLPGGTNKMDRDENTFGHVSPKGTPPRASNEVHGKNNFQQIGQEI